MKTLAHNIGLLRFMLTIASALVFVHSILILILYLLIPNTWVVRIGMFEVGNFFMFISYGLMCSGVAWTLGYTTKQIKIVSPFSFSKSELLTMSIASYFFGRFFSGYFFAFDTSIPYFHPFMTGVTTLIFFCLLPQLVELYSQTHWLGVRDFFITGRSPNASRIITFVVILLPFILFTASFFFVNLRENFRKNFTYISSMKPKGGSYGSRILIRGYKLGWKNNDSFKLMSDYGSIITSNWEDTKIEFEIPLHVRPGSVSLWIERPEEKDGQMTVQKSNRVKFDLIPHEQYYSMPDDSFFVKGLKWIRRTLFEGISDTP